MGLFTFERFTSRRRRPPPPAQHLRADGRDSRIPAPSSSTSSRRSCAKSRPQRVDKGRHDPIRLVFPGSRGTTVQGLKLLLRGIGDCSISKSSSREKSRNFSAQLTFASCRYFLRDRKWMTNFHPSSQRIGPGRFFWRPMLTLMQLTIDAVR